MRLRLAVPLILAGALLPAAAAQSQSPLPEVRPEAVVNTVTGGDQTAPAVAASSSGTVWIAWSDEGDQPPGIKARRFDPSGAPLGPEILVRASPGFPNPASGGPAIGATAAGGSVIAWAEAPNILFRRFAGDGAPLGNAQRIPPTSALESAAFPSIAVAADGSFVLAWVGTDLFNDSLRMQRFDPQGQATSGLLTAVSGHRNTLGALKLIGAADGGFLAVWRNISEGSILASRYNAAGVGSTAVRVDVPGAGYAVQPAAALASDGSARVLWIASDKVWARRLGAGGEIVGATVQVTDEASNTVPVAATIDGNGNLLAAWSQFDLKLQGRVLKDDLSPLSDVFAAADPTFLGTAPALATTAAGNLVLAWSTGYDFDVLILKPPAIAGRDGSGQGIAARTFGPALCAAGSDVLCLGMGGRFQARVAWRNPATGETGVGRALPLTVDTGAFWFFGESNLELMVKVLDGTSVNGRLWVYAGALSDVEYTLTVTDTLVGTVRTYHNPAGRLASLADVEAFFTPILDPPPPVRQWTVTAPTPAAGCLPANPTSLCLGSGHFSVSVQFIDPRTGTPGAATAVPLTSDTGAFWFFDASNLELMIKVLDGRAVNGKFWVFYGALSDVDYTVTVTNTETGQQRTYHNPRGTLASRADTQAF